VGPGPAAEVFAGDPEVFRAGAANTVLEPVMGRHSLLLLDGPEHKRARRLLLPAFTAPALRGYQAVVTRLAREEVARWPQDGELRVHDRMTALTLEVVLQVVFGVTDEERLRRLRPLVAATVDLEPVVLIGWGYRLAHRLPPWKRVGRVQRELDVLLHAEISERRRDPDLAARTDVLSRLLRVGSGETGERPLSDTELRDQLVTLLLAGHETTASALAWALLELGRDDRLQRRARQAADAAPVEGTAHLEAVLKESLRLHPVIPMVVRQLAAPAEVGGVHLPAGVSVAPSVLLTHHDPRWFPAPGDFRPERFLTGEVDPGSWMPFGGGVRRCLGAGFSLMEGVAVLREVLRSHDVRVPPGPPEGPRVRNITSVPASGGRLRVTALPRS
jgi:cytochrome P450